MVAIDLTLFEAERETDAFHGNMNSLIRAKRFGRSTGDNVSERVDEVLAEALKRVK